MNKNNSFILQNKLFRNLFPNIGNDEIDWFFETHPDSRSLKAIKDFFICHGVSCKAYKLPYEKLNELPIPFIAQLRNPDEFVIVSAIEGESIVIITENKILKQRISEFNVRWSGVVLLVSNEVSKPASGYIEKNDKTISLIKKYLHLLILGLLSTLLLIVLTSLNLKSILLILLTVPLFASYSLIQMEYGLSNEFDRFICNSGKRINCESVLKSPISRLFGKISLSYVGFFYFTFLISLLFELYLFNFPASSIFQSITFFCLISIPFSLFFIGYQVFKIRKVCPYCISVQFTIILLGLSFFIDGLLPFNFLDKVYISALSIATVVSAIVTYILATKLKLRTELGYYKKTYQSFKRNPQIFNALLSSSNDKLFPADELVLKLREGSPNICFVLDLSCEQCIGAIKEFYYIKSSLENIGLSISFKLKDEHEKVFSGFIDKIFKMSETGEDWLEELKKWYSSKDYMKSNLYLTPTNFKSKHILKFTKENNLTQSPILLVNNTILTNHYTYYDLADILRISFT